MKETPKQVYMTEIKELAVKHVKAGSWACNGDFGNPEDANIVRESVKGNVFQKVGAATCFAEDTYVWVKEGALEIQYIRPSNEVLSRCEETGELTYRKVLNFFEHYKKNTLDVILEYGKENYDILSATSEHPIWVKGRGWTEVRCLEIGQVVEMKNGDVATVIDVVNKESVETVYNLEVEGFNTYFVGRFGIWVHNCNPNQKRISESNR